ncbi:hypothetical protein AgCh_022196 [Apium graveolens]
MDGAASYLKSDIQRQKKLYSVKSDRPYYPKYRAHNGDIVEMKPNTAKIITTFLGIKGLESDKVYVIRLDQDIRKAKINDLRVAIFQTGEDIVEFKDAKRRMQNELEYAERKNFDLGKNYGTPPFEASPSLSKGKFNFKKRKVSSLKVKSSTIVKAAVCNDVFKDDNCPRNPETFHVSTPCPEIAKKRQPLSPLSVNTLPSKIFQYTSQTHHSPNIPFQNENETPTTAPKRRKQSGVPKK